MTAYKINLHEVIYSLSDALDLVGVEHIHHGKRVAYLAAECGKYLGWSGHRLDDLFQAAILHDSGVSRTLVHSQLAKLDWEGERDHCENGANLLASCPSLAKLSEIVRQHHTHWTVLREMKLPDHVMMAANCIYMADRIDILTSVALKRDHNILLGIANTIDVITKKRGDWFHATLVDAFRDLACSEAFWFRLEDEHVTGYTARWITHEPVKEIEFEELFSIVKVFSQIVDAKSEFTREHSEGVSRLSKLLGCYFELSERNCEMIQLAALLHDLGKLRVPDEILEKCGKLTAEEYTLVRRHSFDTFNVLKTVEGIREIANWASQHHERVDGSGYPYRLTGDKLSLESRIIAVADVFQALAQRRPYREALAPDVIMETINDEVTRGKLCKVVAAMIEDNLDACYLAAVTA